MAEKIAYTPPDLRYTPREGAALVRTIDWLYTENNRLKQDVEALESALSVIQAKAAANGEDVSYLLASNALEKRK